MISGSVYYDFWGVQMGMEEFGTCEVPTSISKFESPIVVLCVFFWTLKYGFFRARRISCCNILTFFNDRHVNF